MDQAAERNGTVNHRNWDVMPKLAVVKINVTSFYLKAFLDKMWPGIRIFETYIYDESSHTYACEMTPSYELRYLEEQWTVANYDCIPERWTEEIDEKIREASARTEAVSYYHTYVIDSLPIIERCDFPAEGERGGRYYLDTDLELWREQVLFEETDDERDARSEDFVEGYVEWLFGNGI